ncbi:MAG: hypothetical protein H0V82_05865 [Candidatus Protochlamydia sp.]|nr:hypothetical protein [Candidatus Protochlamydia sp.]
MDNLSFRLGINTEQITNPNEETDTKDDTSQPIIPEENYQNTTPPNNQYDLNFTQLQANVLQAQVNTQYDETKTETEKTTKRKAQEEITEETDSKKIKIDHKFVEKEFNINSVFNPICEISTKLFSKKMTLEFEDKIKNLRSMEEVCEFVGQIISDKFKYKDAIDDKLIKDIFDLLFKNDWKEVFFGNL